MTTSSAFLDSIRHDPNDDTPRLVFADWLDDNGDEAERAHAELIRVQCELARWVPDLWRRSALQERERQLIERCRHDWLGPRADSDAFHFERGMTCWNLAVDRRWYGPSVEQMWLDSLRGNRDMLAAVDPAITNLVTTLDLDGEDLENADIGRLGATTQFKRLRRLNLANNGLSDRAIAPLLKAPFAPSLQWLDLRNNRITPEGVGPLLDAFPAGARPWIDLRGNPALHLRELQHIAAWRGARPGSGRLTNSIGMDLQIVPAGSFLMGSPDTEPHRSHDEGPQREVVLSKPFYLGVYHVSQQEYEAVVGDNPAHFHQGHGGGPYFPVESVTWHAAVRFCELLSELPAEQAAGRVYRLPTEAEWEHACRAGTTTPFAFGATLASTMCNFDGRYPYGDAAEGPFVGQTSTGGAYKPNAFGLFDMHGNVWEWCSDWFREDAYLSGPTLDPPGPDSGARRVLRGGSWYLNGAHCRSAYRSNNVYPDNSDRFYGFRVAMDVV